MKLESVECMFEPNEWIGTSTLHLATPTRVDECVVMLTPLDIMIDVATTTVLNFGGLRAEPASGKQIHSQQTLAFVHV